MLFMMKFIRRTFRRFGIITSAWCVCKITYTAQGLLPVASLGGGRTAPGDTLQGGHPTYNYFFVAEFRKNTG